LLEKHSPPPERGDGGPGKGVSGPGNTPEADVLGPEKPRPRNGVRAKGLFGFPNRDPREPIAVVGVSGKFPKSGCLAEFWRHLENSSDLVSEVPPLRWDWRDYFGDSNLEAGKTKVKCAGFIDDPDRFDPAFFGISPHEAALLDPQFRLLLETFWATLEDAGYRASTLAGTKTGVFVGVTSSDYRDLYRQSGAGDDLQLGLSHFMIANRTSFLFDFHGPSEVIDTACSSSLVALKRALESLRLGNCGAALVGGVNVIADPLVTLAASQAGMLSEDGRCKTFDRRADGYGRGEGVGAVYLKPLSKAVEDGDHVYGCILGSAENHGGRSSSLAAPNPKAQQRLLVAAYAAAGVDPRTIGYIETHGTGTRIGDAIEAEGLTRAFAELYRRWNVPAAAEPHCALGSVKTNTGHLEAAAGICGLVKVLLMFENKRIPENVHLQEVSPFLSLENTPFYLARQTQDWQPLLDENRRPLPLRAGVSSFGVGGSNVHVVLEEYNNDRHDGESPEGRSSYPIVFSANDSEDLLQAVRNFSRFLAEGTSARIDQIAFTLQLGREEKSQRLGLVASTKEELRERLDEFLETRTGGRGVYCGRADPNRQGVSLDSDDTLRGTLEEWLREEQWPQVLELWVGGFPVDWNRLYPSRRPQRVSLPTYPFSGGRYWLG
jgi:acyl transferase domain-containing protein